MTRTTDDPTTSTSARLRPSWLIPLGVAAAVVLGIVLWLTQPWLLFVDTVADEQLPQSIDAPAASAAAPSINDGDGPTAAATADEQPTADETPTGDETATAIETPTEAAPPPPPGPIVLARGDFVSRDHGTSGRAAIVQLEDGSRVLTIEDLDTDNGPDLFVYLDDDAADAPEGEFDDGTSLGRLRANQGDLVYEIPTGVDLTTVSSVGIWCDRFSSLFGAADLAPVG